MTLTGRTLDDLDDTLDMTSRRLTLRALCSFIRGLPVSSRTWEALHKDRADEARWARGELTDMLLAEICDKLSAIDYHYMTAHSEHPHAVEKPHRIPRPGVKDTGTRHIGSGAIPIKDFEAWWQSAGKHTVMTHGRKQG